MRHLYTFDKGQIGCDFLDSRIDLYSVRSAGYEFVGRYLRNLDRNQIWYASRTGLGIIPIYQAPKAESLLFTGFSGGQRSGELANIQAEKIGIPKSEVIVCAIDTDVAKHNIDVLSDYVEGFWSTCVWQRGLYGDWDILESRQFGLRSRLNIQSAAEAWSYDWTKTPTERWRGIHPTAHLRQYKQEPQFGSLIDRLEVVSTAAIIWAGVRNPG